MTSLINQSPVSAPALADAYALSVGQEAMWFLQQLAPASTAYNAGSAVILHFPVESAALNRAVHRLLARHSLLGSVFRLIRGEVRRVPADLNTADLVEVLDVSDLDDNALRHLAQELAEVPFHLDRDIPIRIVLLRRAAHEDVLVVTTHHIVIDDVSQISILRDLLAEYARATADSPSADPDPDPDPDPEDDPEHDDATEFDDYVRRQRDYLASPKSAAAAEYWHAELAAPVIPFDIPTDHPRPAVYQHTGAEVGFPLTPELVAEVADAANVRNVTPFAYLMSVFQLMLYRHTGQTHFIVGYPATHRTSRNRWSVGYYINTLPMCGEIDPDAGFTETLAATNRKLWRGLMHRDYPAAMMPRLRTPPRDPSRPGLISVMFGVNTATRGDAMSAGLLPNQPVEHASLTVTRFDFPEQQGQFDLSVLMIQHEAGSYVKFKYNTSLFEPRTANRLASDYVHLLERAVAETLPARLRDLRPAD